MGLFYEVGSSRQDWYYIDAIYLNVPLHNGTSLLLASLLVPFQIYSDLGGYSLIAIGTASVLGIKVMQNFQRPFLATSMADLWRRWHRSLITWLTDYVYTPLNFAFRKYKLAGIILALMITFLISGIWHGPALTFVIWGLMQGVYLSIEALTSRKRIQFEKKHRLNTRPWYIFLQIIFVYILFTASQIVGRAGSVQEAIEIYRKIFVARGPLFIGDSPSILIFSFIGLTMLLLKDFADEFTPTKFLLFENKKKPVRVMAYASIIILILLIGVFDGSQFMYFKF